MVLTAARPLVLVELTPLRVNERSREPSSPWGNCSCSPPFISATSAKLQLLNMSRQGMFSKGWPGAGAREATYPNRKRGEAENEAQGIDMTNFSTSVNNPARGRGLWLKPDLRISPKCKPCTENKVQYPVSADVSISRTRGEHKKYHNYGKTSIISGDIVFRAKDAETDATSKLMECKCHSSVPVTHLRSDNPLDERGIPCYLRGYIFFADKWTMPVSVRYFHHCVITSGTLVQVTAASNIENLRDKPYYESVNMCPLGDFMKATLSGKSNMRHDIHDDNRKSHPPADVMEQISGAETVPFYSKLSCYNKEMVESLSLRMSKMLSNTVWIGTTPHALDLRRLRQKELKTMEEELDSFWERHSNQGTSNGVTDFRGNNSTIYSAASRSKIKNCGPFLLREGALLVHNSHPDSGKTTLVATIAKDVLKCHAVHVISAPVLFAEYGASADAALETTLHQLVLRCAVKGAAVVSINSVGENVEGEEVECRLGEMARACIILDHLETFLPLSSQAAGDPYFPVLNSMAVYLNRLSHSLKSKNEFPFPSNNPLYNVCSFEGSCSEFTLPVGIILIGVTTCMEGNGKGSIFQNELDAIGGGRFRVPLPSAATRLSAFEHSFKACGVKCMKDSKKKLSELAVAATCVSGGAFLDIARKLRSSIAGAGKTLASEQDLKMALALASGQSTSEAASFSTDFHSLSATPGSEKATMFSSVGGNAEAKLALEDALTLNPAKRRLLLTVGLRAPTGVLLYGPPGTGKTLLARAVAQLFQRKSDVRIGITAGAFVALKASDIVRPEVGNSEKLIASAFETARAKAPSVVFIDEFQALFGDRESDSYISGHLASTLLQCIDDVTHWTEIKPPGGDPLTTDATRNDRVVVLGATNTPWMIDKAFLRPGRFDRAVYVGLPSPEDREEILHAHVSRMRLAPLAVGLSPVDDICKSMSTLCLGFSGADLTALCQAATVRCLSSGDMASGVKKQHFLDAFMHDVVRSSDESLVKRIWAWRP